MASLTNTPATFSLGAALRNAGRSVLDFFIATGRARARCDEIEALMALSDEQLAAKGLERWEIVRHVHRDIVAL